MGPKAYSTAATKTSLLQLLKGNTHAWGQMEPLLPLLLLPGGTNVPDPILIRINSTLNF